MDAVRNEHEDFLMVPVPKDSYLEVIRFLAQLGPRLEGRVEALSEQREVSTTTLDYEERLRRLKASSDVKGCARAMMDLAANRPDEWVPFSEAVALVRDCGHETNGSSWDMRHFFTVCARLGLEQTGTDLGSPLDYRVTRDGIERRLDPNTARVWQESERLLEL